MAKRSIKEISLDFAFFTYLWQFIQENRKLLRQSYQDISKRFLDFNDPKNHTAYLWEPQYEALEVYIFLKEYLGNAPVHEIFTDWVNKKNKFSSRANVAGQLNLLDEITREQYQPIFDRMQASKRSYSNYIFALTMGTGKTKLMATCIFYEFILANKFPKDTRFCHNALVFAPDKTVLQSLREIETFDKSKVVPPEYVNFLNAHLQFHYLVEAGTALSVLDKSKFNIIVSNVQKIILKRQAKERTPAEQLFGSGKPAFDQGSPYADNLDLLEFGEKAEEVLTTNQRFEKLRRLEQLGIYVDEAHHAFGTKLAKDLGVGKTSDTSLRKTIDELSESLNNSGTKVVACYNYTGTPYVGQEVLPEVVYAYGLQEAIDKGFLKKVAISSYENIHSDEFVDDVIHDFIERPFYQQRHEEKLPKLAFFASTIEELQTELKPAVESALIKYGIPTSKILVNVGDEKLTTNDDLREFIHLDDNTSEKQYILLVNKGREGWNCRSLFGVALFRSPKSRIFVLQATMRCLRAIGPAQQTASVYLSMENRQILDEELEQNFHLSVDELEEAGKSREIHQVKVEKYPLTIKLKRIHRQFSMKEKEVADGFKFDLASIDKTKYKITVTDSSSFSPQDSNRSFTRDATYLRKKRAFSQLTLVAEISRYLNRPCLEIEAILDKSFEGTQEVLNQVNEFNEILYDVVILKLFQEMYDITDLDVPEEYEVDLVKMPPMGYYQVSAPSHLVVGKKDVTNSSHADKTFHLNPYCFDSDPERNLFWHLIQDGKVKELYFTGMLTHGQSDFFVQYIDPESHTVRSYYPDFLIKKDDGSYVIVEVKGDNKIDDPVVQAKSDFAARMAVASGMSYQIIKGSDAARGNYSSLLTKSAIISQAPLSNGVT